MSKSNAVFGGIGFFGVLQIVFITLKLTKYIDWPWWQVMWPLLLQAALTALLVVIIVVLASIKTLKE